MKPVGHAKTRISTGYAPKNLPYHWPREYNHGIIGAHMNKCTLLNNAMRKYVKHSVR